MIQNIEALFTMNYSHKITSNKEEINRLKSLFNQLCFVS